ncbi:MAG: DUF120 domain-containing protein [Nanoarchaeota archaeon]
MGIIIEGIVSKGLGEGAFFMSMPHYKNEIKKKLGFEAYPGTLNIKVPSDKIPEAKKSKSIRIEGYAANGKTFAGALCHIAKIKEIKGAVIFPDLTRHKGILEFIAPVYVKSALSIKDGDKIKVELK